MPQKQLSYLISSPKKAFYQIVNIVGLVRLFVQPNECLYTAIETNCPFWVNVAIKFGANIKSNYGRGLSALHVATKLGKTDITRLLIQKYQADIHAKDETGRTPLFLAFQRGNIKTARILIQEFNAPINTTNMWGESPLHLATKKGKIAKIHLLLKVYQVDVNLSDKFGKTPLHYAARTGNLELLRLLIEEYHADIHVKNKRGITPLFIASKKGHLQVIKYLLDLDTVKSNPNNGRDLAANQNATLLKAVELNDLGMINQLLNFSEVSWGFRSNPDAIMQVAKQNNRPEIMARLIKLIEHQNK